MICCKLTFDRDVIKGNERFWGKEVEFVAMKVWKKASDLGIRGGNDDGVYVAEIKRTEQSDRERCASKDDQKKVTK